MTSQIAVGIDIGATSTKIGLVHLPGRLVELRVISSRLDGKDAAGFFAALSEAVEEVTRAYPIEGIGVALCSVVNDEHSGALFSVNAPALNNWDIRGALRDRFGCPVRVMNDGVAHAAAEVRLGAGRGARRVLSLVLGTGVVITGMIDGRPVETWGGISADAGRVILQPDSEFTCKGGVRGSAEALCGTAHIEHLAERAYGRQGIAARDVITAARSGGDQLAASLMAEIGRNVGHLLAIASPIFFPQRIVVSGGTAEAGSPFFQAIRDRYACLIGDYMAELAKMETGQAQQTEIVKGELGPDAGVIGAAVALL